MSIKAVSATKQFQRVFSGPLDPTSICNSYDELLEYVKSPTSYPDQILGCNGKAYIIGLNDEGEKVPVQIGTVSGGGNVDIPDNLLEILAETYAPKVHKHGVGDIIGLDISGSTITISAFHIGPTPPENTDLLWIDTSEETVSKDFENLVLAEVREIITSMQEKINKLEAEVEYLKLHGGGGGSTGPDKPDKPDKPDQPVNPDDPENPDNLLFAIVCENGEAILTESGEIILLESYTPPTTDDTTKFAILTESGDILVTESGDTIVLESYKPTTTTNPKAILTETGDELVTESNNIIILEV